MTDTEVVEAPEAEEPTDAPDNEELTPDDDLEPDDERETIEGPDEPDEAFVAPQSEKEIEKSLKALEKEAKRHSERVRAIMGDETESLVECEACEELIPGFHYHADFYEPGSAERALAEMLAGGTDGIMQHPAWLETCPECNGYGQVLTGARVEMTRLLTCPECKGAGYLDTRQDSPPPPIPDLPSGEVSPVAPAAATDELERDMWGRPKGHVRYGKFPIYLTDEERAADVSDGFTID